MIKEVIKDMFAFLIVMLIVLAAFTHCFMLLSDNNDEDSRFVGKGNVFMSFIFVFQMALGAFDTEKFGNNQVWLVRFVFILAMVFLMIVLLNLLIAIISETFSRV